MQIVLRSDVEKVGKRGDIVAVADGYARNFLVPRGLAMVATEGIANQAKAMRTARDRADAKAREEAQLLAAKFADARVRVGAKAGAEGKLFGSVTAAEIADAANAQLDVTVTRRQIELGDHIKTVGEHPVTVKLHSDVRAEITVVVEDSAS